MFLMVTIAWTIVGFVCYAGAVDPYYTISTFPKRTLLKSVIAMVVYGPAAWVHYLFVVVMGRKFSEWLNS